MCEWKLMCVSGSEGALSKRPFSSLKPPVSVSFLSQRHLRRGHRAAATSFPAKTRLGLCAQWSIVKNGIHHGSSLIYHIFCAAAAAAISLDLSSECTQPAI